MAGDRVLRVVLVGNSKSAVAAIGATEAASASLGGRLKSVASGLKSVGKTLTSAGKTLTHYVTAPVVAAGVASMVLATDFSTAMTRIQTQAGGSAKDVDFLSKRILNMGAGGKVQQAPIELANAMYHLKSVGMDNVDALKALRASSDLAAVGNVDLEETTNAVAGAWRTGIKGATNFKGAVSTLNAIIGAGNMSMEDLNGALGTGFLPVAKTFGLTLKDVGSALAVFTDEGVPADAAATRLRMSFSLLAAPSKAAEKVLKGVGLSGDQLGRALRSKGLVGAIGLLKDHLQGLSKVEQSQVLSRAFGGGRSSAAIMGLINNFDVLKKKEKQVEQGIGRFGKSVEKQAKTPQAQFHTLISVLESLGIKLGNVLLPYAVKAAKGLTHLFQSFEHLSPTVKKLVGIFVLIVAAAGPLLMIVGSIAIGIAALASPVGLIIAAIVALAAAFAIAWTHSAKFRDFVTNAFKAIKPVVMEVANVVKNTAVKAFQQILPPLKDLGSTIKTDLFPALQKLAAGFKAILPVLKPIVGFILGMFVGAIVGAIKGVIQVIKGIVQVISGVVNLVDDLIHGRWSQIWGDLWTIIKGVLNIIVGGFKVWWNAGILAIFRHGLAAVLGAFKGGWRKLIGPAEEGVGAITRILKRIVSLWTAPYRLAFKLAKNFVKTGWAFIKGEFTHGVGSVRSVLGRVIEVVKYPFERALSAAKTIVVGGIGKLLGVFRSAPGRVGSILTRVKSAVTGAFSNALSLLNQVGKWIIQGMINGMGSMISAVTDKAKSLAHAAIDAAKGALHINSPSKVFIAIGKSIGEGFVKGLVASRKDVDDSMSKLMRLVKKTGNKGMIELTKEAKKHLDKWADRWDKTTKRLADTKANLDNLKSAAASLTSELVDAVTQAGSVIFVGSEETPTTFSAITKQMQDAIAQAGTFQKVMAALKGAHLNDASLKQLFEGFAQDPANALASAQAILNAGAAGIEQINTLASQLSQTGNSLGTQASDALYASGIKAADALVDRLTKRKHHIAKMMRSIADDFVDELRKMLPKKKKKGKDDKSDDSSSDSSSSGDSTARTAARVARAAQKAKPRKDMPAPKGGDVYVHVHVAGNVIGEKDFAKRVTPTVREELTKIKRRNRGPLFG